MEERHGKLTPLDAPSGSAFTQAEHHTAAPMSAVTNEETDVSTQASAGEPPNGVPMMLMQTLFDRQSVASATGAAEAARLDPATLKRDRQV